MVVAASEVVMRNRNSSLAMQGRSDGPEYVLIDFPYFVKFREGFPKGHLVEKTVRSNTYKINAVRLLNWLYNNGYSRYNARELVAQTKFYERLEASIGREFDIL
jgi:hypothetical protein